MTVLACIPTNSVRGFLFSPYLLQHFKNICQKKRKRKKIYIYICHMYFIQPLAAALPPEVYLILESWTSWEFCSVNRHVPIAKGICATLLWSTESVTLMSFCFPASKILLASVIYWYPQSSPVIFSLYLFLVHLWLWCLFGELGSVTSPN